MKFFYCSFNEWKKLETNIKKQYLFLATSYTTPVYFTGKKFNQFVPSESLHKDACVDFPNSNFMERYTQQIHLLNKHEIFNLLKQYNRNIIVFLVWEAENKPSERDVFIPWLTNCNKNDIKAFSFLSYLNQKEIQNNSNIFNL